MTVLCLTCLEGIDNSSIEVDLDSSLCTKDVLIKFFPEPIVKQVLKKHRISDDKATHLAQELEQKNSEITKTVEERTEEHYANEIPSVGAISKIYQETVYEIFANTLKDQGVDDEDQIQIILEDIKSMRKKLFVDCIRREYSNSQ
jgi:hypothetical protein